MIKRGFWIFVSLFLNSTGIVNAASPFGPIDQPYGTGRYGTLGSQGFGAFISNLVAAATIIAGLGFLIYLIYGAFRYLTSAGDEKAVTEARKAITHAFIGLLIIVLSLAITFLIGQILGFDILRPEFSGP